MNVPLEISFRKIRKTQNLEELIRREAESLEDVNDHVSSCRVSVEQPQKHLKSGSPYRVRIDMTVPPKHELVARREPGHGEMHEELQTVILDTFDDARRQLRELNARQAGEEKRHPAQETTAIVHRLVPDEDFGFLKTLEGRDVYFHRNSVVNNGFDRLAVGTGVRHTEEIGEKGLQATTVRIVDKPGPRNGKMSG
ncbi:MAG: cold shock domain-containing protein [Spirochaetaceae bacterium]